MTLRTFKFILLVLCIAGIIQAAEVSAEEVNEPSGLVGRWEGYGSGRNINWSSDFLLEVFAIDIKNKTVIFRQACSDCTTGKKRYQEDGQYREEKGKIFFQTVGDPVTGTLSALYEMKGNKLSGSASRDKGGSYNYFDYSLKKVAGSGKPVDAGQLRGRWIWNRDKKWAELLVTDAGTDNKPFRGRCRAGMDAPESELIDAKQAVIDGKFRITFSCPDKAQRYSLTFYPALGDYVPVLWGVLETEGNRSDYAIFEKKE